MPKTGNSFLKFLASRVANFRRITWATRGEYSEHDLHGEAWIIASRISEKRGYPIDFSNPEDQNTVLQWLYNQVVRYTEKISGARYAWTEIGTRMTPNLPKADWLH